MSKLDFREHGLVDVESLVYDFDLLSGLLLIPLFELTYEVFVNVIRPVVNLQDVGTVLRAAAEKKCSGKQGQ